MAIIASSAETPPAPITKFLGLNEGVGETQLVLGESPYMRNFRITDNGKLQKREGYSALFASLGANKAIRAMWYGKVGSAFYFLFACNGKLYHHNRTTHENTEIGSLTDGPTLIFGFQGKAYIADQTEYRSWDGTTYGTVTGYRPLVFVSTPPAGKGTELESLNQLNGAKRMWFDADGAATIYQLPEAAIASVDWVKLNGVTLTLTTHYTVNLTNGTVSPVSAAAWPTGTPNNIEIAWTKGTGYRSTIAKMCFAVPYGPANDTRIFAWGDTSNPNTVRYTGLADGVPSAEYWPSLGAIAVGSDQSSVMDCMRQQDRLNITTDSGTAWYATSETVEDALGRIVATFPTYPLHGAIGSIAPAQGQLLNNQPVTVWSSGIYAWQTLGVKDERNAVHISQRVQPSLDEANLSSAKTVDWDTRGEYWVCVGSDVWIQNYRLDVWYRFDNIPAICFLVIDGVLYFGTAAGQIHAFNKELFSDNDTAFTSRWEMAFYGWGLEYMLKSTQRSYVSLLPEAKSHIDVTWETENETEQSTLVAEYNNLDYGNLDYGNFTYSSNYSPEPFPLKTKAKKWAYFKIIITNDRADSGATVLAITIDASVGGRVK